jgi:hypothetical protein
VLVAAIWVLACVAAQLQCVDAARAAARAAARGDAPAAVQAAGRRLAPAGARIELATRGDTADVAVRASVRPFGRVLAVLPSVQVAARASAPLEAVEP